MTLRPIGTRARRLVPPALVLAATIALQGCVSYTSNYKPDPRTRKTVVGLDRDAAQSGPTRLSVETIPTAGAPSAPLAIRLVRTMTGPEANIERVTENAYKRQWTPFIIPLGALFTAISPVIVTFAALSPDDKVLGKILGVDDPDPCKHGLFAFATMGLVGIIDSCDIVDSRTAEEKQPTGKTVSEETGIAKADLEVRLQAKGEEPVVRTLKTDANGRAALPGAPLFRSFRSDPGGVDVVVRAAGNGGIVQEARLDAETAHRLYLPVSEERAGDRALADGKGLIALEQFSRAAESTFESPGDPALRKKIFETYRALPVKPPVPEDTRRLLVQAEAMAQANDSGRAITMLEDAIRRTPWLPTARYNLAMTHVMNQDYGAAIESMNAYLALAPDAPDARKARDLVYQWEAVRDKGGSASPAPESSAPARPAPPEKTDRKGRR